jgi:hypothetical protein
MRHLLMLIAACAAVIPELSAVELKPLFTEACGDDLLCWEIVDPPSDWLSFDTTKTPRLEFTSPNNHKWIRNAYLDQGFEAQAPGATGADQATAAPTAQNANADGHAAHAALATDAGLTPSGKAVLRIRHTPRSVGVHHWVLFDPTGKTVSTGELTVKAPREQAPVGPLQVNEANMRLLGFRDGTVFIPIGPNIAWATGASRMGDFARYCSALHENGGNHARVWMASWWGGIESAKRDEYRLDQAWLTDQVLAMARANHLKFTMVLDNHDDIKFGKYFPYGADYDARLKTFMVADPPSQYERRLRYILARWGADDCVAAWELCNEVEQAQPIRERAVAWVKGAAALLAKLDQDNRLHTVSWSGDDWDLVAGLPHIDLTQVHSYVLEWNDPVGLLRRGTRDGVGMLINNAARANALLKPFCFSELGYQGSNEKNPGNDLDGGGLLLRQQLWAGFMLGGYGTGMNWWWDVYMDKKGLWTNYRGFASVIAHIKWDDKDLAPLTPNQDSSLRVLGWQSPRQLLLWPQLRTDTWYSLLRGMLPDQAYTVHDLDMATGDERANRTSTSTANGNLDVMAVPPLIDTVLWVEVAK